MRSASTRAPILPQVGADPKSCHETQLAAALVTARLSGLRRWISYRLQRSLLCSATRSCCLACAKSALKSNEKLCGH